MACNYIFVACQDFHARDALMGRCSINCIRKGISVQSEGQGDSGGNVAVPKAGILAGILNARMGAYTVMPIRM